MNKLFLIVTLLFFAGCGEVDYEAPRPKRNLNQFHSYPKSICNDYHYRVCVELCTLRGGFNCWWRCRNGR